MDEKLGIKGFVDIVVKRADGTVKEQRHMQNLITNAGLAAIADLTLSTLPGTTPGFQAIAIGVGSGQTAASTQLASESTTNGGARRSGVNVTQSRVTTTETNDTAQLVTTFTFTGVLAITEAMIGNDVAANTGTMLSYRDFTAINVDDTDTLTITWKIVYA